MDRFELYLRFADVLSLGPEGKGERENEGEGGERDKQRLLNVST